MLQQRIIFGTLLTIAIVALVLADGWLAETSAESVALKPGTAEAEACGWPGGCWLRNGLLSTLVVLAFACLAAREVTGLLRLSGSQPVGSVVELFVAGFVLLPYVAANLGKGQAGESWGLLWAAAALGAALLAQALRRQSEHAMRNVAATLFVIVYIGGLASYLPRLRLEVGGAAGAGLLLFSVFLVKMNDVGAYFTGRLLGRHKLIGWLSPNKTWEGFIGGVAVTVLCALTVGSYLHHNGVARLEAGPLAYPWGLVWFGLLMALFSVGGDLAGSLLKRDAAVKDSARAIPGFGGVLDLLDSPLLAAPVAWLFWTRLAGLGF